jgi:hypothetical protein
MNVFIAILIAVKYCEFSRPTLLDTARLPFSTAHQTALKSLFTDSAAIKSFSHHSKCYSGILKSSDIMSIASTSDATYSPIFLAAQYPESLRKPTEADVTEAVSDIVRSKNKLLYDVLDSISSLFYSSGFIPNVLPTRHSKRRDNFWNFRLNAFGLDMCELDFNFRPFQYSSLTVFSFVCVSVQRRKTSNRKNQLRPIVTMRMTIMMLFLMMKRMAAWITTIALIKTKLLILCPPNPLHRHLLHHHQSPNLATKALARKIQCRRFQLNLISTLPF